MNLSFFFVLLHLRHSLGLPERSFCLHHRRRAGEKLGGVFQQPPNARTGTDFVEHCHACIGTHYQSAHETGFDGCHDGLDRIRRSKRDTRNCGRSSHCPECNGDTPAHNRSFSRLQHPDVFRFRAFCSVASKAGKHQISALGFSRKALIRSNRVDSSNRPCSIVKSFFSRL